MGEETLKIWFNSLEEILPKFLKVRISPSQKVSFIYFSENRLILWKMFFISYGRLFLFLRYLPFRPDLLAMYRNGLIRKLRLISILMTSKTGQQIIIIRILSNILRSKGNEKMKFRQLIKYKIKNIFLENLCTKCGGGASPRLFYKNSKLSLSLCQ